MRRTPAALAVLALSLALWGAVARAGQPAVPAAVGQAIVKAYPGMAYVAGRLPAGYRFTTWGHSKRQGDYGYQLDFSTASGKSQLTLQVLRRSCPAPPSWPANGTLHVNRHAIKWSRASTGTTVWRCLKSGAQRFVIFGVNGPLRKLAYLVGFARPAR
jgi:hypothetical protein